MKRIHLFEFSEKPGIRHISYEASRGKWVFAFINLVGYPQKIDACVYAIVE